MIATERPAPGQAIVYDPAQIAHIDANSFTASNWPAAQPVEADRGGRGSAWFVGRDGTNFVLRHYRRGGLPGRLVRDRYWFVGEATTRSFAEWHLLQHLVSLGLPVPSPVAAHYRRSGFFYTADLITARLPDVVSLAQRLQESADHSAVCREVGSTIHRFHHAGLWHADLNANNIQLNEASVWLIDFDRSRLQAKPVDGQANLRRLSRSLRKLAAQASTIDAAAAIRDIHYGYAQASDVLA
ncbi:MAG: 3-deoxy-D-manno-octulosonic acid kinase [Pseudomonadota bacterium]